MKIRMLTSQVGDGIGHRAAGTVIDVDKQEALRLIRNKLAEPVKEVREKAVRR